MSRTLLLAIVLVCAVIGLLPSSVAAETPVRLYVEAQEVHPDVQAFQADWKVMVPLRAVAELLGYAVSYEDSSQTITLSSSQETVVIQVGQDSFTRNGERHPLGRPVELRAARAFVATDALQAILGGIRTNWDADLLTVRIYRVADYPYPEMVEDAINRLCDLKVLYCRNY